MCRCVSVSEGSFGDQKRMSCPLELALHTSDPPDVDPRNQLRFSAVTLCALNC